MRWNRRRFVTASSLGAVATLFDRLLDAQATGSVATDGLTNVSGSEVGSRQRVDSIDWYVELQGHGPALVLIPSGEGDCASFAKVAATLSGEFTVLTFDMPGFSRSSDPPDFSHYSMSRAASEITALVRALGLGPATFYGCSSGGHVALCLAAERADIVRNVVIHEVAGMRGNLPPSTDALAGLPALSDDEIVRFCIDRFRNELNENADAWDALGPAFHQRLRRNYVTWARRYLGPGHFRTFEPGELRQRPVTWTVGSLTPTVRTIGNIAAAHAAGLDVGLLACRHFPQVSIPGALAAHIARAARAHVVEAA